MNTTLEVIAPSVEEAIDKGLAELGLTRDAVEVETLDSGTRGLFGLGSRQARIRLTIKGALPPELRREAAPPKPAAEQPAAQKPVTPEAPAETHEEERPEKAFSAQPAAAVAEVDSQPEDATLRVARDTVIELLDKMKVHARVTARFGEADEGKGRVPILVEVLGDDLSILIGKRAETLNALQYIAGLIISKELQHAVSLVVDVEGYRARRVQHLRQLAQRMAEQALKTGRRQVLEPMPANERRIIHIELRNHPDVSTESIGDDPQRKVTIVPKD